MSARGRCSGLSFLPHEEGNTFIMSIDGRVHSPSTQSFVTLLKLGAGIRFHRNMILPQAVDKWLLGGATCHYGNRVPGFCDIHHGFQSSICLREMCCQGYVLPRKLNNDENYLWVCLHSWKVLYLSDCYIICMYATLKLAIAKLEAMFAIFNWHWWNTHIVNTALKQWTVSDM